MRTTFDSYKARAGRLDLEGVDFDDFRVSPLTPEALRSLRYMHDVEHHTVCYLRDLLLTPAHADPDVTSFLSCWVFEEMWHGEAIGRVLEAHGEVAGAPRVAALRRAEVAGHPTLRELLRRIMRQEGGHIDFYASEAARRLAGSPKAQRLTRFAMAHWWRPVGSGVMPKREVGFLVDYLFGSDNGREALERIDRRVDRLPGLGNLHLLQRAVTSRSNPLRAVTSV